MRYTFFDEKIRVNVGYFPSTCQKAAEWEMSDSGIDSDYPISG